MARHETTRTASDAVDFHSRISLHANHRMHERCITVDQIDTAIRFGRTAHVRGATIYVIGKREMERLRRTGITSDRLEGLHVVCNPWDSTVITTYRNRDMSALRKKPRYYPKHHHLHGNAYPMAA